MGFQILDQGAEDFRVVVDPAQDVVTRRTQNTPYHACVVAVVYVQIFGLAACLAAPLLKFKHLIHANPVSPGRELVEAGLAVQFTGGRGAARMPSAQPLSRPSLPRFEIVFDCRFTAFYATGFPRYAWVGAVPAYTFGDPGVAPSVSSFVVSGLTHSVPHPFSTCSANLVWNQPGAFERARQLLRDMGVLS